MAQRFTQAGAAAPVPARPSFAPQRPLADAVRRLMSAVMPAHGGAALLDDLRAQLQVYQDRLAGAPTETTLRFSHRLLKT